jgi:hypothetical protein
MLYLLVVKSMLATSGSKARQIQRYHHFRIFADGSERCIANLAQLRAAASVLPQADIARACYHVFEALDALPRHTRTFIPSTNALG